MNLKKALILGAGMALLVGCSGSDDTDSNDNGDNDDDDLVNQAADLEIFSWWREGAEERALEALLEVHTEKYPRVTVTNAATRFEERAEAELEERLAEGEPPSTFQSNFGERLFRWVTDGTGSKLQGLNDLRDDNGWEDIPQSILDTVSIDGTLYALPVNMHRLNTLYYNKTVMDAEGLSVPDSPQGLSDMLATLKERGYLRPACLGNVNSWTAEILVFDAIFPAFFGADMTDFWEGDGDEEDPRIAQALEYALEIWPNFNPDVNEIDWVPAMDYMVDEDDPCVVTPMGDWAKGHFENELGLVGEEDFLQRGFPGANVYVGNGDAFPLPRGVENRAHVEALLETFGSIEGQTAFNKLKGSIPSRRVNVEEFDPTLQATIEAFQSATVVLARPVLTGGAAFPMLADRLKTMLNEGDIADMVEFIQDEYAKLK